MAGGLPQLLVLSMDHYRPPALVHLAQRDVAFAAIFASAVSQDRSVQEAYGLALQLGIVVRQRLQLRLPRFFTKDQMAKGEVEYNYADGQVSRAKKLLEPACFYKDNSGDVFHTYSAFSRAGGELQMGTYNFLDLVPKGRDGAGCSGERHVVGPPRPASPARKASSWPTPAADMRATEELPPDTTRRAVASGHALLRPMK